MRAAERRWNGSTAAGARPCPAARLVVGLQCGGSDAFSGVTANPAVGYAADLLVRAGATVMFSEVTEVRDAVHLLTPRATPEVAARDLVREMRWYDDYLRARRRRPQRQPHARQQARRAGEHRREGARLGGQVRQRADRGVTGPASELQRAKGLVFAATPASDFICGTLQLAAGMNLHVFTTGEGTPYGLAWRPSSRSPRAPRWRERWPDLIDVDAGRIADGAATIEDVGWEMFQLILEVASGRKKTWAEHWGLAMRWRCSTPGR